MVRCSTAISLHEVQACTKGKSTGREWAMCFETRKEEVGLERLRLPVIPALIGVLALMSIASTILTIWE
jgi:hypothetical protein